MKSRPEAAEYNRRWGAQHRAERSRFEPMVLAGRVDCVRCGRPIEKGEPWDLGHDDTDRRRYTGPEHRRCNRSTNERGRATKTRFARRPRPWEPPVVEEAPEPEGIPQVDERWRVPWLADLVDVPANATWPRLMTVPHPDAAGSLGPELVRFAEQRTGHKLRWWQKLVACRVLEVDADGALLWEAVVLSLARQLGKSWLFRELCLWRIQEGERFGEPQDVLHTGKDVNICLEIQRPARSWARLQPERYKVREINGREEIEFRADGSRWLLRAKKAVNGYAASCAFVDEAWKIEASTIEDDLAPTMAERVQPQIWLVSTAHRRATSLMLNRRQAAIEALERGDGDLLIEWSAPRTAAIDDPAAWRQASPHWSKRRERVVRSRLAAAQAGETSEDEPDPIESFRAQWLCQWPKRLSLADKVEELFPPGQWQALVEQGISSDGPIHVAVEDDFGLGAAVACAAVTGDGRIELDGWLTPDWDTALFDAARVGLVRRVRTLLVGASMLSRVPPGTTPPPRPAGGRELRPALALLRDLAANGMLVHDASTEDLDRAFASAQVTERADGLVLTGRGPRHLVRAAAWAAAAAHRPAPVPAIL